jgi:hypothetical protein
MDDAHITSSQANGTEHARAPSRGAGWLLPVPPPRPDCPRAVIRFRLRDRAFEDGAREGRPH